MQNVNHNFRLILSEINRNYPDVKVKKSLVIKILLNKVDKYFYREIFLSRTDDILLNVQFV